MFRIGEETQLQSRNGKELNASCTEMDERACHNTRVYDMLGDRLQVMPATMGGEEEYMSLLIHLDLRVNCSGSRVLMLDDHVFTTFALNSGIITVRIQRFS